MNLSRLESPATTAALVEAIRRALTAIMEETRELRGAAPVDYAHHRRAKDLCLLDLLRRNRLLGGVDPGADARAALRDLRDAIIENQAALKIHLAAARAVSNIILNVIVEEDSDRTYSRPPGRRGPSAR